MSALDGIRQRAENATPGPWETSQSADEESTTILEAPYDDVLHHDERGHGHMRENFAWMKRRDAEFIAAARTDIPRLLAALDAVKALHKPVRRYQGKGAEEEGSWLTPQEVIDYYDDGTGEPREVTHFETCAECGRVEAAAAELLELTGDEWGYAESLWPCKTMTAIMQAIEGEAE